MKKLLLSLFCLAGLGFAANAQTETLTFYFTSLDGVIFTDEDCTENAKSGNKNLVTDFYYRATEDSPVYKFKMNPSEGNSSYFIASSGLTSAFFGKQGAYMELPVVDGYKITSIKTTASSGCSGKVTVSITTGEYNDAVCSEQKWGNNVVCTYEIPAAEQNSALRLYITNPNNAQVAKIEYTLVANSAVVVAKPEIEFPAWINPAGVLAPFEVTLTAPEADKIVYTTDGTEPTATEGTAVESGATIDITGTTTLKAVAVDSDNNVSAVAERTFNFVELAGEGFGTPTSPYDVTRAIAVIDNNLIPSFEVCVKGVVSSVEKFDDRYGQITYWLDDDSFEVYGGLGLNKEQFTSADDIHVGDNVVVCGNLKKYNDTYEFNYGNYLIDQTTGIEAVAADSEAPVVYYNLQGVRVSNPACGIFVRVQGNTATKVLVK